MAGVIPVIFAASVDGDSADRRAADRPEPQNFGTDLQNFFNPQAALRLGESILIICHVLLHRVTFNPVDQGGQPEKVRRFIPGATRSAHGRVPRPHPRRLTFPGALFLAAVAALPTVLINQTSANFFFGGTSILIVIGVALDTMNNSRRS